MRKIVLFLILSISTISIYAQNRYTHTIYDDIDSTMLEQFTYEDSTLIKSTHYVYESLGDLAVTITYSYRENGVVDTRTIVNYKKNRIIGRWQYTSDDLLLLEEIWKYNNKGQLIRKTQTFYDGAYIDKLIEKRIYKKNTCTIKGYLNKKLQYEYSNTTD